MSKQKYIIKPYKLMQEKDITPLQQDYLCVIYALGRKKRCWASDTYLMKIFGVSKRRVQAVLHELRKKDLIRSVRMFVQEYNRYERVMEISREDLRNILKDCYRKGEGYV